MSVKKGNAKSSKESGRYESDRDDEEGIEMTTPPAAKPNKRTGSLQIHEAENHSSTQQKEYCDPEGYVTFGITAPEASQSVDNIELPNGKIAIALPADTEFVLRRQSVSELSGDSNTSIASIADSIFSNATGSSMSSVVGLTDPGERLVTLLLNDSDLSVLCREALNRVTPDRFERNLRRLLTLFAIELRKEAENPQQRSAAHFVRYRYNN
jgi:hypothetical protein